MHFHTPLCQNVEVNARARACVHVGVKERNDCGAGFGSAAGGACLAVMKCLGSIHIVFPGSVFQVTANKSHRRAFILMDTPVLLLSGSKPYHMAAVQREDFITLLLSRTIDRSYSLSRLGTFRDNCTQWGTPVGDTSAVGTATTGKGLKEDVMERWIVQ